MVSQQLPEYDVYIHPRDLMDLKKDIWNDEPVDAYLRYNQKRYTILTAYRGTHIREQRKKSYHITFETPKLFYGKKEMHLNAEYQDPSLMRNKLSMDFFRDIGVLSPTCRHVVLKVNGRTEGIYLQLDSVDEFFLKQRKKAIGSIFYAIDDDANFSLMGSFEEGPKKSLAQGYEHKCGNKEDVSKLEEFIYIINVTSKENFAYEIERKLDTEKYLRWLAGVVCTQNYDGFVHNYSLYLDSEKDLFEIMPWDFDATWGRNINGGEMPHDYARVQGYNTLSARLLDLPKYQVMYIDIMRNLLKEKFQPDYMEPRILRLFNDLLPYIEKDPYMKNRKEYFLKEPEYIIRFIHKRNAYLSYNIEKWADGLGIR